MVEGTRKRPKFRFGSVRFRVWLVLAGSARFGSAKKSEVRFGLAKIPGSVAS